MRGTDSVHRILVLVAVICFILAAFGVSFLGLNFIAVGLAFFAGSFLI